MNRTDGIRKIKHNCNFLTATAFNGEANSSEVPAVLTAMSVESSMPERVSNDEEMKGLAEVPDMHQPMVEESSFDILGGRIKAEPTVVHRHMPDWIAHPHLVEADIRAHSKSIAEFSLPDVILKNLGSMGVSCLFPVQSHVVPHLIKATTVARVTGVAPNDLLVCAPTGCGKTLCYVVPVSCALLDYNVRKVKDN